jgi:hypothetical protein
MPSTEISAGVIEGIRPQKEDRLPDEDTKQHIVKDADDLQLVSALLNFSMSLNEMAG